MILCEMLFEKKELPFFLNELSNKAFASHFSKSEKTPKFSQFYVFPFF